MKGLLFGVPAILLWFVAIFYLGTQGSLYADFLGLCLLIGGLIVLGVILFARPAAS